MNYCRWFIRGYSVIATPLTNLLKTGKRWIWGQECRHAFEALKKEITEEPVLAFPDLSKPFELHTDAFDFAIGGVLMQEDHPIAFESQKLNDIGRRYMCKKRA